MSTVGCHPRTTRTLESAEKGPAARSLTFGKLTLSRLPTRLILAIATNRQSATETNVEARTHPNATLALVIRMAATSTLTVKAPRISSVPA